MKQEFKERLARPGRTEGTRRASSGSPVGLAIRPAGKSMSSIDAIGLLTHGGLSLLRAKRTIEFAMEHGLAHALLPAVEDIGALVGDLRKAGFRATRLAIEPVDVKDIRENLGLSQEQFAVRFNLDLQTVQNWEQGRYTPDRAAANYLRVIARQPREAAVAQEEEVG